jgi:hypothetical protein
MVNQCCPGREFHFQCSGLAPFVAVPVPVPIPVPIPVPVPVPFPSIIVGIRHHPQSSSPSPFVFVIHPNVPFDAIKGHRCHWDSDRGPPWSMTLVSLIPWRTHPVSPMKNTTINCRHPSPLHRCCKHLPFCTTSHSLVTKTPRNNTHECSYKYPQ